jgi:putative chitinase
MDAYVLAQCTGAQIITAQQFLPYILASFDDYAIDTLDRQAAYLAQIGHESGGLRYTSEIWGPTSAQLRYEGRVDLGNTTPGDGSKFRGRGLIQITGRANYAAAAKGLDKPLLDDPELLSEPELASTSAAWWWNTHGLNAFADSGDFPGLTKKINGALTGYSDRFDLWQKAREAMGLT